MSIPWDESVLLQMAPKARAETLAARSWLLGHIGLSQPFIDSTEETHPAIWFDRVMSQVEDQINTGNHAAIELGCRYIIEDPKTPFGRIHKRKVIQRLRKQFQHIPKKHYGAIRQAAGRIEAMNYKSQEYKDLIRLVNAIDNS